MSTIEPWSPKRNERRCPSSICTSFPGDRILNAALRELAREAGVPIVATNDVHLARRRQYRIQQVATCIRTGRRIDEPNVAKAINAEAYLKSPRAMAMLFHDCPEAAANTLRIAERVETFPLGGRRFLPRYAFLAPGEDGVELLRGKTYAGAHRRYRRIPERLKARIDHELNTIFALGFTDYFLILADLVEFAGMRGIRFAGRGSSADSVVAYCLHLTNVDAFRRNHRFERFMSLERANGLPDIDIDVERGRREVLENYLFETYGSDHTAGLSTYFTYRARGATREVGKVLGFKEEEIDLLAKRLGGFLHAGDIETALDAVPEVRALNIPRHRFRLFFELCREIAGIPRHSMRHSCGVVITGPEIYGIAPIEQSAQGVHRIPFDKVDIEDIGLSKFDLLSLPTLEVLENTERILVQRAIREDGDAVLIDEIPLDDEATFELIRSGETAGTFQIESPGQRALQSRQVSKTIEDVIQSVAAIRPGPIKGEIVEPWVRRKLGLEPVTYLVPELRPILESTGGVPLFQEQIIDICVVIAGFSPGEADVLRRAMTHRRTQAEMTRIAERFVRKAMARGYSRKVAEEIYEWVSAYGGYGFCEGHAAAFGMTAYQTAYLLAHHPVEFYSGLLNHQPMGFWPTHVLVQEARRRGISILPLDVNRSVEDSVPEEGAIRVGWKCVRGLRRKTLERIVEERDIADFADVLDFLRRVRPTRDEMEKIIMAGAFDALHSNRRALLWAFSQGSLKVDEESKGLALDVGRLSLPKVSDFSEAEKCALEWRALGFSPSRHPFEFTRKGLDARGILSCAEAKARPRGSRIRVAGFVIRPHKPPTKSGQVVVFFTLSDETGLLDVTTFPRVYERHGAAIFQTGRAVVEGRISRKRGLSLVAERIEVL